jgi:ferric iron reductase protein FhuF
VTDQRPDVVGALRLTATLGPFFAFNVIADEPDWRPMIEIRDRPEALFERIVETRKAVAANARVDETEIELRVAASIAQMGLVARLVSPALGAAVLAGIVPSLQLETLRWRNVVGGPVPVAMTQASGAAGADIETLAEHFDELVLRGAIAPVVAATRASVSVSETVLWGNVASAVGGAATMITRARPGVAKRTYDLVAALLDRDTLRGTADLGAGNPLQTTRFRRNSCCLYYRIPAAGICGDCVLTPH